MLKWFRYVCLTVLALTLFSPLHAQNCGDNWPIGLSAITPGQWWFLQDQAHPSHYLLVSVRNYVQDHQGRTVCPVVFQKYPDANDYWAPGQTEHLHDFFLYDASKNLWQVEYDYYPGISDNGGAGESAQSSNYQLISQPGAATTPSDLIFGAGASPGYSFSAYYTFNLDPCSTGSDNANPPCGWWPVSYYASNMPSNAPFAASAQLLCTQFSEGVNPSDPNTQSNPLVNGTPKPGSNVGYTNGRNNAETWCFATQGQGLFRLTNNYLHFCWYYNLSDCPLNLLDTTNGNFDGSYAEDFMVVSFTNGGFVVGSGPYPWQFGLTP